MAPGRALKTYSRGINSSVSCVEAMNFLFAKNIVQRKLNNSGVKKAKNKVKTKKFPRQVKHIILHTHETLNVEPDDTFEKLRKGPKLNINYKNPSNQSGSLKIDNRSNSVIKSFNVTLHSPMKTRSKTKVEISEGSDMNSWFNKKTLSKNRIDNTLEIEGKSSTGQLRSKKRYKRLIVNRESPILLRSKLKISNVMVTSAPSCDTESAIIPAATCSNISQIDQNSLIQSPIFTNSVSERILVHSSTPLVSKVSKKLIAQPISPIKPQDNKLINVLSESLEEIRNWGSSFPKTNVRDEENSRKSSQGISDITRELPISFKYDTNRRPVRKFTNSRADSSGVNSKVFSLEQFENFQHKLNFATRSKSFSVGDFEEFHKNSLKSNSLNDFENFHRRFNTLASLSHIGSPQNFITNRRAIKSICDNYAKDTRDYNLKNLVVILDNCLLKNGNSPSNNQTTRSSEGTSSDTSEDVANSNCVKELYVNLVKLPMNSANESLDSRGNSLAAKCDKGAAESITSKRSITLYEHDYSYSTELFPSEESINIIESSLLDHSYCKIDLRRHKKPGKSNCLKLKRSKSESWLTSLKSDIKNNSSQLDNLTLQLKNCSLEENRLSSSTKRNRNLSLGASKPQRRYSLRSGNDSDRVIQSYQNNLLDGNLGDLLVRLTHHEFTYSPSINAIRKSSEEDISICEDFQGIKDLRVRRTRNRPNHKTCLTDTINGTFKIGDAKTLVVNLTNGDSLCSGFTKDKVRSPMDCERMSNFNESKRPGSCDFRSRESTESDELKKDFITVRRARTRGFEPQNDDYRQSRSIKVTSLNTELDDLVNESPKNNSNDDVVVEEYCNPPFSNASFFDHSFKLPFSLNKMKEKSIVLKPGKLWRRSLLTHRRDSVIDLTNSRTGSDIFSECSMHFPNVTTRPSVTRESTRIVPITLGVAKRKTSMLQSYAQKSLKINGSGNNSFISFPEVRFIEESLVQTARQVVLRKCGQSVPLMFDECYPESLLKSCKKIGEGVYGEVFLYTRPNGQSAVMKVIPIEGDKIINGERQKKFQEILSEIVIALELSKLRGNQSNQTSTFSEVQRICCVFGKYPRRLLELWNIYDNIKGSENDSPEIFDDDQLYIVLDLANGGQDLEAFIFNNASQVCSMFQQVAYALAVAEEHLKFEHRDLHWGNVLLSSVDRNKKVIFKLKDKEIETSTRGVEATIIDFTLSRMEHDGVVIFNDLGQDPDLFIAKGDYQFEIYRLMKQKNGNDWQKFEPYTNILWLHYILTKSITALRYKNAKTKIHKENIKALKEMKDKILDFNNVCDFVLNCY